MIRQANAARNLPRVIVLHMHNGPMKSYNYLVADPSSLRAVIVDPAWEIEKIDRAVADTEATLSGILITHSHLDHIHLANPLAEKHGCPIWMSNAEIAASGFDAEQLVGIDTSRT